MALSLIGSTNQSLEDQLTDDMVTSFVGLNSASARRYPTGQHPCHGLFWTLKDTAPSIVFMLSHYTADFSEHYLGAPLAKRGYGVLGWNTRFTGAEDKFVLEQAMDDIAAGSDWIRKTVNPKKIIFIGNSGGGSLMAAFQARTTKDPSLTGADAMIFLNAHPGRADVLCNYMDPAVVDESDPVKTNLSLDIYNNPSNKPPFPQEFIARYRAAQRERSARITKWAKEELKRLNKAGIPDRIFAVHRTMADIRFVDPNVEPSERPFPACYGGDPKTANSGVGMLSRASTLRTWLSMWSLEDSKARFDHIGPHVTIPALVIQAKGDVGVYPSDARKIYDLIGSADKEIHMVPGSHFFESSQESFEGAIELLCQWVDKKFPS